MANAQAFGRRASSSPQPRARTAPAFTPEPAPQVAPVVAAGPAAEHPAVMPAPMAGFDAPALSVEDELREWKAQRSMKIPWRQLSFIASLCFGIASFELPDSVNDEVNWLLYGLMAISFYIGVSGWFGKRVDAAAERRLRDSKN